MFEQTPSNIPIAKDENKQTRIQRKFLGSQLLNRLRTCKDNVKDCTKED